MAELSQNVSDLLYAEHWDLLCDNVGRAVSQSFLYGCAGRFEIELLKKRVRDHKIEMAK